jgi:DNA relaxase NicK
MIIDWCAFTVHGSEDHKEKLWADLFANSLGKLTDLGHGGQGFRTIETALQGAKVYSSPVSGQDSYYHVVLPGKACACLIPEIFGDLLDYLRKEKFNFTRLDFAFDAVEGLTNTLEFSPRDFFLACCSDSLKSFANKKTVKYHEAPYEEQENGKVGTSGAYLGSRSSDRMIRVYDLHGFTRLEFQVKNDRADIIGKVLFDVGYTHRAELVKHHLRQFCDFKGWEAWDYFIGSVVRSDVRIGSARIDSLARSKNYVEAQVAPTLSVLFDVMGRREFTDFVNGAMERARKKGRKRYRSILESQRNIEDQFLDEGI